MIQLKLNVKCIFLLIYFVNFIYGYNLLLKLNPQNDKILNILKRFRSKDGSNHRVTWVKRYVPRSYKSPHFEFDEKTQSIFVPKYRVQKQMQIQSKKNEVNLDEILLRPFGAGPQRKLSPQKLFKYLEAILKVLRNLERQKLRNLELSVLRQEQEKQSEEKHHLHVPHESLWNYWTYDRTLNKDRCPGDQAKVNNMCIWVPPNRK